MPSPCSPPILVASAPAGRFALGRAVTVSAKGFVQQNGPPDLLTGYVLAPQIAPPGSQALTDPLAGDAGWGDQGATAPSLDPSPPPPPGTTGPGAAPNGLGIAAALTGLGVLALGGWFVYEALVPRKEISSVRRRR